MSAETSNEQLNEIKAHIEKQLHTGLKPDEVVAQLKNSGYQDDDIKKGFALVQNDIMPSSISGEDDMSQSSTPKRGRIKTGWLLMKQSLGILKSDKMLVRYIIMSAIYSFGLAVVFFSIILVWKGTFTTKTTDINGKIMYNLSPLGYIPAFIYYILAFFIVNLYAAGLAANVLDLFSGKKDSYAVYMKRARAKAGPLFIFSLIEATIGLILRAIAERSKLLGRIAASIFGAIWSIARLFVVPIIVSSDEGAFSAIRDSTKLLVATWGENIIGRVSLGGIFILVFLLVALPISILFILLGALIGGTIGAGLAGALIFMMFIALLIIGSAASNVLNVALFYYAKFHQIPASFDAALINSTFIHKKPKKGSLAK
jgi:hypothetical protein